jgi:GTPase SAR1 family protein
VAIQQQAAQHKKRASALRIKIISMGAPGVGKSCLIKRYCEEKFVSKYIGTIGVDYGVKVSVVHPLVLSTAVSVRLQQAAPSKPTSCKTRHPVNRNTSRGDSGGRVARSAPGGRTPTSR